MSSVQAEFDAEIRRLLAALANLSSDLKADPKAPSAANLDDFSAQLSANLTSGGSNRDLIHDLKHELELFERSGVLSRSLSDARELIYIFQEHRFSGLSFSSS